jgi:hypothetical protein
MHFKRAEPQDMDSPNRRLGTSYHTTQAATREKYGVPNNKIPPTPLKEGGLYMLKTPHYS